MKKILVATDFSTPAENAARYAWHLAKGIKANLELFNAFKIPVDASMAAQVAWPLQDYQSLQDELRSDLSLLADKLTGEEENTTLPNAFIPAVNCSTEVGGLGDVISDEVAKEKACLVVMGMSGAGMLSRFFLGSNSHDLINRAAFPLLLIPAEAHFKGLKKIALATDLSDAAIPVINTLATLAQHYHAEILLSHITDDKFEEVDEAKVCLFLKQVTDRVNYPKVYYRHIKSQDFEQGLEWLTEHGHVDMLVMIHHQHGWLERVLNESYTQRIARRIEIPLMVFPEQSAQVSFKAF